MYLLVLIAGFGGGVIRGLMGFIKHQYSYKNVGFNVPYFLGTSFLSGTIGALAAIATQELGISFFGRGFVFVIG